MEMGEMKQPKVGGWDLTPSLGVHQVSGEHLFVGPATFWAQKQGNRVMKRLSQKGRLLGKLCPEPSCLCAFESGLSCPTLFTEGRTLSESKT